MKSPFPGMDPYLERHWEDVYHRLVQYACDQLQPQLPEDLVARIEERVFLESDLERIREIKPDCHVAKVYPAAEGKSQMFKEGDSSVAEPIIFEFHQLPVTEGYIQICDREGGKVITIIEFLSPTNKCVGTGREKYLEKQAEVLRSDTSLVEIDLVRTGDRVLALPGHEVPPRCNNDYLACISPGWKRNRRELYPMPLRQRLPILPIPLRPGEERVTLNLQALVDQAYSAGRYQNLNYRADLHPPLPPDDAAWAAELLNAAGRR